MEYRSIINKIINKSFPILKNKRIFIIKFKSKIFVGGASHPLPFLRIIFINPTIKNKYLKAILIHELCHLEVFEKRRWLKYCFIEIAYWFNKRLREKEEKDTDKLAIKKGYAKDIYDLCNYLRKDKNRKELIKYYLSPKEIRFYAKKIKKWQSF
ncbi:MAG: hypothetical protein AABX30_00265 [Nanoarchaeota archaeon]